MVPDKVVQLIDRFHSNQAIYRSIDYKTAQIRQDFIDPLFEALGWDLRNHQRGAAQDKTVIFEDVARIAGATRAPDYWFQVEGDRQFFVAIENPTGNLAGGMSASFPVRRYGWSAGLPVSVLTNFAEFAVYDGRVVPQQTDKPATARSLHLHYTEYADRWEELYALFSREAVLAGSLARYIQRYIHQTKPPKRSATVETALLQDMQSWRKQLTMALFAHQPDLEQQQLNFAVQMTIHRLIFLRICEDRGIAPYGQLRSLTQQGQIYQQLCLWFQTADDRHNAGFHFQPEQHESIAALTRTVIPDRPLQQMIQSLYYPHSPYEFSVMPIEILGQVYEQVLGQVVRLSVEGAIVENKPEIRKAGGVYYTPAHIVDYMVQNTVGRLLVDKTPDQAENIRVLDPACGAGAFLLGAYQFLLNWYLQQYAVNPQKYQQQLHRDAGGEWRLGLAEKQRILRQHIFGVDIDAQAVETTKLSLLLRALQGESPQTSAEPLAGQQTGMLTDLAKNIQCGNSLIGLEYDDQVAIDSLNQAELCHINAFSWEKSFPEIIRSGGFDVVIGNPPYIDSEWMTKYLPYQRQYCRRHYRAADGNWDMFCIFAEKAIQICKPGGLSSLIVPNKLASAAYAAETRYLLSVQNRLISIRDYASVPVFSVAVYPIVYCVKKEQPQKNQTTFYEKIEIKNGLIKVVQSRELEWVSYFQNYKQPWSFFSNISNVSSISNISSASASGNFCILNILSKLKAGNPCLGEIARVQGAATVGEAYEIQGLIREYENTEQTAFKLINSGTIDRYNILWGSKKLQYLKQSYQKPVIPVFNKAKLPAQRLQQAEQQKIVVAGMTKCLECVLDLEGTVLAGKSTSVVRSAYNLNYLAALLNSKLITFFYQHQFCGNALNGGYLSVGPPQLRILPIYVPDFNHPPDQAKHDRITQQVKQMLSLYNQLAQAMPLPQISRIQHQIKIIDRQIDQLVYELYGLTEAEIAIIEGSMNHGGNRDA